MNRTAPGTLAITMALALAACGDEKIADNTPAPNPTVQAPAQASASAPVSEKPMSAIELETAFLGVRDDVDAWNGRQITVAGTYGGLERATSTGDGTTRFHVIVNTPGASLGDRRTAALCFLDQEPSEEVKNRGPQDELVVTGTVKRTAGDLVAKNPYAADRFAKLDPCRIVK